MLRTICLSVTFWLSGSEWSKETKNGKRTATEKEPITNRFEQVYIFL